MQQTAFMDMGPNIPDADTSSTQALWSVGVRRASSEAIAIAPYSRAHEAERVGSAQWLTYALHLQLSESKRILSTYGCASFKLGGL